MSGLQEGCRGQGWRLDPLLLFCQLLTAGTALGFALEVLRLRQQTQANPVRRSPLRRCRGAVRRCRALPRSAPAAGRRRRRWRAG